MIAIAVEPDDPGVLEDLNARLVADNRRQVPGWGGEAFLVTLRDAAGALVGGLRAVPNLGACEVRAVWIDPDRRGGAGRRLMDALEAEAARRGYAFVFLDTYDFQARGFYERIGYTAFSELDYPDGTKRFWLRKALC